MTDRLWAPWRMEFIVGPKASGCVLCGYAPEAPGPEHRILARSRSSYVVLNKYPYAAGHLMVVPMRHVRRPDELEPAEHDDLFRLVTASVPALERSTRCEGVNVGLNLGKVAGAGIEEHLHVHLVPRWAGDNNFMPVIADTRVMPEHLRATWERLAPEFEALDVGAE